MAAAKRKTAKKIAKKVSSVVRSAAKKGAVKVSKGSKAGRAGKAAPAVRMPKAAVLKPSKIAAPSKPFAQSEFFAKLAETSGLTKQQVKLLFAQIKAVIAAHLGKGGPGSCTIPGMMKLTLKVKPATKARKGRNPFTGEEVMFKAKPARTVIKIRPMKKLKELV